MMAVRGWGSYLRDVLKVLAIHRNSPTRFDQGSITALLAGAPSNRPCSVDACAVPTAQVLTASSGFHRWRSKTIPLARTAHASHLVGQRYHDDVAMSPLQ